MRRARITYQGAYHHVMNRGYVFQDRYKSMLIQDDSYLMISIAYVLNNPVRVNIANNFLEYEWLSGSLIFNDKVLKNAKTTK